MISIIIPVYNQPKQLKKCLASIERQTYQNFELILVNDRSSRPMSSVVRPFKQKFGVKMEIYNNQVRHGAPYARNKGYCHAKGEYLLFCDADIIMKESCLETMMTVLQQNPKAGFVYSSHRYGHKLFKFWPFDIEKLKQIPYVHSTSLLKKAAYPPAGWDESLKKLQDWDFFLQVAENGYTGVWINKVLFTIQPGGVYSNWMPSFFYKLFPFLPKVRRYKKAKRIVQGKYNIK